MILESLVDVKLTIETVSEEALHPEAVTRIEEEEREPKVAVLQPDKTKGAINSVNNVVEILSVSGGSRSGNRGSLRERSIFRRSSSREGNHSRKLADRGKGNRGRAGYRGGQYRTLTPGKSSGLRERSQSRENVSESDREEGFESDSCRNCGQRGHGARACKSLFEVWKFTIFQKRLPVFKLKKADMEMSAHLPTNKKAMVKMAR